MILLSKWQYTDTVGHFTLSDLLLKGSMRNINVIKIAIQENGREYYIARTLKETLQNYN